MGIVRDELGRAAVLLLPVLAAADLHLHRERLAVLLYPPLHPPRQPPARLLQEQLTPASTRRLPFRAQAIK